MKNCVHNISNCNKTVGHLSPTRSGVWQHAKGHCCAGVIRYVRSVCVFKKQLNLTFSHVFYSTIFRFENNQSFFQLKKLQYHLPHVETVQIQ